MSQHSVTIAVLAVLSISLGGCMMAMHGGGHAMTPLPANQSRVLATGQTEHVTVDVIVREAETPRDAIVTVRVTDTTRGTPIEGARVSVRLRPVTPAQGGMQHGAAPGLDNVELTALAAPDRPGVYEARHTFRSAGPHDIRVAIRAPGLDAADLLVLTATYDARAAERNSPGLTPLAIAGGVAMAVFMILRLMVF